MSQPYYLGEGVILEADLKRDLVATLLKEGGYGRRLEDKYAVGTLDLLLVTQKYTIYAEVKMLRGIYALPARVAQRNEIVKFNRVHNVSAWALVIGYKDGSVGFGLPGQGYDANYVTPWPLVGSRSLSYHLDRAVEAIFAKEMEPV